jgi:hypothetical protein
LVRSGPSCASQQIAMLDFRFGSKADIGLPPVDVRYSPKSGHDLKPALPPRLVQKPFCLRVTPHRANVLQVRVTLDDPSPS